MAVFQGWIQGGHKTPVTWTTLIDCLDDASFTNLARDLKKALEPATETP